MVTILAKPSGPLRTPDLRTAKCIDWQGMVRKRSQQSSGLPPLASVFRPWKSDADSAMPGCAFYSLNLDQATERKGEPVTSNVDCQAAGTFGDIIDLKSPDGIYTLRMVAVHPNWETQTITVSASPSFRCRKSPKSTDTQYNFELTWLDLPLTDNTRAVRWQSFCDLSSNFLR